jgi:photosystem II stability/assembly factor-like uncharacterized protein
MNLKAVVVSVALVLLAGCTGEPEHGEVASLAHIHGLGIDPADGTLYAASHHGLFSVDGKGKPKQVAGRTQDFMGFTVVGPNHFLGSGHPGLGDDEQPPHLGLIESTDAGNTWKPLSLSGEADFHALEAKRDHVYGFDSQTGRIMVSDDTKTWEDRAALPLADIAVSPDSAEEILATTEQGVQRSTDGARNFSPIEGSPALFFIDWADTDRLVGVAPDGVVHVSDDGGTSWTEGGSVSGQPQAILAHGESDVYVATDQAIHRSTDGGSTFSVFQEL